MQTHLITCVVWEKFFVAQPFRNPPHECVYIGEWLFALILTVIPLPMKTALMFGFIFNLIIIGYFFCSLEVGK